ncbi:hypothetical protein Drorol1_Dr00013209 [Drosera rotundifolia]
MASLESDGVHHDGDVGVCSGVGSLALLVWYWELVVWGFWFRFAEIECWLGLEVRVRFVLWFSWSVTGGWVTEGYKFEVGWSSFWGSVSELGCGVAWGLYFDEVVALVVSGLGFECFEGCCSGLMCEVVRSSPLVDVAALFRLWEKSS